jgi:hypothetical protein
MLASRPRTIFILLVSAALADSGCGGSEGSRHHVHVRSASLSLGSAVASAKQLYGNEVDGQRAYHDLRFIASDQLLLEELSRGEYMAAQAEAYLQMINNATRHITRVSVIRGGHALVNAVWNSNGSFVAAPVQQMLRLDGQSLGTLLVSIQDVVGYAKLVHHDTGAQVVVRGASGQVRTSLPAAARAALPSSGAVNIAGAEYDVGMFHRRGWGGEPLSVWVLMPR